MRKRSGAIHSQSEEQFIMLAQKAYGKNGIFYDDKHYHKIAKSFIKKSNSPNDQGSSTHPKTEDPFKNFDYNEKIQQEEDLRRLEEQIKAHGISSINIVVVCNKNQLIFRQLEPEAAEEQTSRGIDLIIRKKSGLSQKQYVFKYWLINRELCLNFLYEVYLQQAARIFAVGLPPEAEELKLLESKYKIYAIQVKEVKSIFNKFETQNLQIS